MDKKNINLHRLKNFPISFFSVIMGLAGFTLVLQKVELLFKFSSLMSLIMLYVVVTLFIIISIIYSSKIFLFKEEIVKEFNHPIKINFFPTISISILLISMLIIQFNEIISMYLWLFGTSIHFVFTLLILSIWFQNTKYEYIHFNPAWFIPIVGNMIIPLVGVEFFPFEISWFFFSIGLIFWIVLLTIFVNRIIFHHPLPSKLLPTLFILIAPPAIASVSLIKLIGDVNEFILIFYNFGLFLVIFLIFQFKVFKKIEFYLSWWAYSFPIAALTLATYTIYENTLLIFYKYLFILLFFGFTILITVLIVKTIIAIKKNQICIEE